MAAMMLITISCNNGQGCINMKWLQLLISQLFHPGFLYSLDGFAWTLTNIVDFHNTYYHFLDLIYLILLWIHHKLCKKVFHHE